MLSTTCSHRLGIPPIYVRLPSFPLQPAHSVTPVTFAYLWQSRALPHLTAASTMVETPSYCTSTARGQLLCYRSMGGRQGGREPDPAQPRQESAPLTSPRRCPALHYIFSVFTEQITGGGAGSSGKMVLTW